MSALPVGAWNARLLGLFALGVDVVVNLPAARAEHSQPIDQHPLGAILHTLSPAAAQVRHYPEPCAVLAFADQRCVWLHLPTIWARGGTDTGGAEWLSWGSYADTMRQRCLAAGWQRIAWLMGVSLSPELAKVACYSLGSDRVRPQSEWLVTATETYPLA